MGSVAIERIARHALPASLLVGAGVLLFPAAGRDDSHITYWSAHSLAHFGEILNYNGERIEQSSSLLQVLLLAAVHGVSGFDLVAIGRVLSILCGVAALVAAHQLAERVRPGSGLATAFVCASSAYFAYWSFGGLDASLASLTALLAILAWASHLHAPGHSLAVTTLATAGLALVRPEMPAVMLCMLLGAALLLSLRRWTAPVGGTPEDRRMLGRLGALSGVCVGVCALLFGFRLTYFDSLFPQPVIAKAAELSWQRAFDGLRYLVFGVVPGGVDSVGAHLVARSLVALTTAVAAAGALRAAWTQLRDPSVNAHTLVSLVFLAAYSAFVVLAGGDWMEGGRMISHALPVAAVFVAFAGMAHLRSRRARRVAFLGLLVSQLAVLLDFTAKHSSGMPLWTSLTQVERYALDYGAAGYSWFDRSNRDHLRNITTLYQIDRIVDQLLIRRDVVHIAAHQMGVMPYYLTRANFGHVRFLDFNGLTDRVATDAAVFSSLPRSSIGVDGVMVRFIVERDRVEADPAFVRPDVTVHQFYQHRLPPEVFRRLGYEVVYEQTGDVSTGSRHLPGSTMWANQLIAVRRELLPELFELPPRHFDIREAGVLPAGSAW